MGFSVSAASCIIGIPEQSAELHVYHLSGSGLIRLKIITENDITAYYEFRI